MKKLFLSAAVLCLFAAVATAQNSSTAGITLKDVAQSYHSPNCPGDTKCMQYAFLETVVTLQPPRGNAFSIYVIGDVYGWCPLDITTEKMEESAHDSVHSVVASRYSGYTIRPFNAGIYVQLTREDADRMRANHLRGLQANNRTVVDSSWQWIAYGRCHP